ncbi:2-dehydropantoate 2-reductase family protein [Diplocarpon rosae]|nr:2-dehydropantoate 2-reductase family protein [Diplocarpon rosae]
MRTCIAWSDASHRAVKPQFKSQCHILYTSRSRVSRHYASSHGMSRKPTKWTEDQATRATIVGLSPKMQMFGFAFARMDIRPPVRFIVNSNMAVDQFYRSNGQIKLVQDDVVDVAEGFDIEQVEGLNLKKWRAVDMAKHRHLKLKTLVLETNHRFSKSVVPNPDHMNWTYEVNDRTYKKPVKFLNDATGVIDPTEPEMKIVESRLLDGSDFEMKVMDNKAAESDEPIKHLIVDMEPSNLSACLMGIKHRMFIPLFLHLTSEWPDCGMLPTCLPYLIADCGKPVSGLRWDSTILFIQKGMGIQEMLDQDVFTDPETRPNYMIGTFTINLTPGKSVEHCEEISKDDPLGHLMERYINQSGASRFGPLVIHSASPASLCISPVLVVKGENPQQYAARKKASYYLIDLLLKAKVRPSYSGARRRFFVPFAVFTLSLPILHLPRDPADVPTMQLLNTEIEIAERHRDKRYKQTAIQSIVPSMAVMFNCLNGGILEPEPERREVMKKLIAEAGAIMSYDIRGFSLEHFQNILAEQITNKAELLSPMMIRIASGKETSVEWTNGYMVKRGTELAKHGVPFPHQHLQMFNYITEKTRECGLYLQALQEERAKLLRSIQLEQEAEQKRRMDEGAALPSSQDLWLERQARFKEKIDLKHDKAHRDRMKMERRRMNPLPQKDFTAPATSPFGKTSLGSPLSSSKQEKPGRMQLFGLVLETRTGGMKKDAEARVAEPSEA